MRSSWSADPRVFPRCRSSSRTSSTARSPTRVSTRMRPSPTVPQSRAASSEVTAATRSRTSSCWTSAPCLSELRPSAGSCPSSSTGTPWCPPRRARSSPRMLISRRWCPSRCSRESARSPKTTTSSVSLTSRTFRRCPADSRRLRLPSRLMRTESSLSRLLRSRLEIKRRLSSRTTRAVSRRRTSTRWLPTRRCSPSRIAPSRRRSTQRTRWRRSCTRPRVRCRRSWVKSWEARRKRRSRTPSPRESAGWSPTLTMPRSRNCRRSCARSKTRCSRSSPRRWLRLGTTMRTLAIMTSCRLIDKYYSTIHLTSTNTALVKDDLPLRALPLKHVGRHDPTLRVIGVDHLHRRHISHAISCRVHANIFQLDV
mmetsp:Transcript_12794/g.36610  ORF Transcript_12794/g.36610 Transcript_12794/m.36610 type:complete len:368 (+) Transcript_12794:1109-2212(+)